MEMDKAIWSRIENGGMSFPADEITKLADITGNNAPLIWLAQAQGFELRPLKSELQEQLETALAEKAETDRENALLRKLILERR